MTSPAERDLLQFLQVQQTAQESVRESVPSTAAASARASAQPAGMSAEAIANLRKRLLADPDAVLSEAPALLGENPDVADGLKLLNDAEAALRTPRQTLSALAANLSDENYELPEKYRFPSYDPTTVPIRPSEKKFESAADAPAWAATAVAAWFFRLVTPKPDLPVPAGNAVYPLSARGGQTTVALFSDWGTGYYHSRYIARNINHLAVAQAVHLGDVYYTGTGSQFEEQFTPPLVDLIKTMPFYAMNANHEMDSHGIPYLEFLAMKRQLGTQAGFAAQPQESSYFCLSNDGYLVIGIDTAYHDKARYKDDDLKAWLRSRLEEGRDAGKVTILLSQNEPYGPEHGDSVAARGLRELYTKDLGDWAREGLIHLWFWGDDHYAALFASNDDVPFLGSCIGHGGYPFGRMHVDSRQGDVTQVVWAETEARFPEDTGQRQDRGNNGFCVLNLESDGIALTYWDWLLRRRFQARLVRDGGRLRIAP